MMNEGSYPDMVKAGLRKKKKKLVQGELAKYDPAVGRAAEDKAAGVIEKSLRKKLGVKY